MREIAKSERVERASETTREYRVRERGVWREMERRERERAQRGRDNVQRERRERERRFQRETEGRESRRVRE